MPLPLNYLNPTDACQTNASKRNNTGTIGKMSRSELNNANVPGNFARINIFFVSLNIYLT